MSTWQTTPIETDDFPHWAKPGTLDVDIGAGSGSVRLERRSAGGSWQAFESFDASGAFKVEVVNSRSMRINPANGAQFRWTWNS